MWPTCLTGVEAGDAPVSADASLGSPRLHCFEAGLEHVQIVEQRLAVRECILSVLARNMLIVEVRGSVPNAAECGGPICQSTVDGAEHLHLVERLLQSAFLDALHLTGALESSTTHDHGCRVRLSMETLPGLVVGSPQFYGYLFT
jgi:hypothetical protein